MGTAVAERRSRAIEVLQLVRAYRQWMSGMKAIHRAKHAEAMVDGLGSRWRLFVELIADIIE
jgi:hypothetical protein